MTGNDEKLSFFEFCEKLKNDGAEIGEDWHIYLKGKPLSRQARNGYYILRKMYNNHTYYFCEHRVIWYFVNGEFNENLTINHKDFDRANNNIENLELMTIKENLKYTRDNGRSNIKKGEESGKALFTNEEVKAIRYLKKNGWKTREIADLFDVKWDNTINRVVNRSRYGEVPDASDVVAIYPSIVNKTWNWELQKEERIKNAIMGLCGETGEFTDLHKKHFFHGHELDLNHLMLELGDVLYYMVVLCIEYDIDFSEICYQNMSKLNSRYKDGFSVEASLNRKEGDI